jgi:hypothetical protein
MTTAEPKTSRTGYRQTTTNIGYSKSTVTLPSGIELGPVWASVPDFVGPELCASAIDMILFFGTGYQWQVGDILLATEARSGDAIYNHLAERSGLLEHTLENMAWLANRFPRDMRRDDVPWSFHRTVAALDDTVAALMLDTAAREGWHNAHLRNAVAKLKKSGEDSFEPEDTCICPNCGQEHTRKPSEDGEGGFDMTERLHELVAQQQATDLNDRQLEAAYAQG